MALSAHASLAVSTKIGMPAASESSMIFLSFSVISLSVKFIKYRRLRTANRYCSRVQLPALGGGAALLEGAMLLACREYLRFLPAPLFFKQVIQGTHLRPQLLHTDFGLVCRLWVLVLCAVYARPLRVAAFQYADLALERITLVRE